MLTNIPNLLTLLRIVLIPVVTVLLFMDEAWSVWTALAVYTIAGLTDYADGYLAREWDQVSALGKFLDPIADKLMVGVVLFMVIALDRLEGVWIIPAIIIMAREFVISGLREFLGPYKIQVPVSKLAKWKTFIQMLMIGFVMVGPYGETIFIYTQDVGRWGLLLASVLTVITGWTYLTVGIRQIQALDGRPL